MANQVRYNPDSSLVTRFFNLTKIGTARDNHYEYEKNLGEKAANTMLNLSSTVSREIFRSIKDPRIITIAIAVLAMAATSYVFYPALAAFYAKAAITMSPFPSFAAIKLGTYLLCIETILGYTIRAESRFCNSELMNQVYHVPQEQNC